MVAMVTAVHCDGWLSVGCPLVGCLVIVVIVMVAMASLEPGVFQCDAIM